MVADSERSRDGRFIESIGFYNPLTNPPTIQIDAERALYWLSQGAQPSDIALRLLRSTGVWERFEELKSARRLGVPSDGIAPAEEPAVAA